MISPENTSFELGFSLVCYLRYFYQYQMTNKAEKDWVWPGFIHSGLSGTFGEPYMSLTFNVRSTTNQNTVYLVHPSSDWTIGNSIRTVPVVFNLIKVQWVSNEKLWKISPLVEQNKSLTTLHIYNFFPGHYGYLHTFINKSLPTGANKN